MAKKMTPEEMYQKAMELDIKATKNGEDAVTIIDNMMEEAKGGKKNEPERNVPDSDERPCLHRPKNR